MAARCFTKSLWHTYTIVGILICMSASISCLCVFDTIKLSKVVEAKVPLERVSSFNSSERTSKKLKRDIPGDVFKPIRITTYFSNFSDLSSLHASRLQTVVERTAVITTHLFSVIPVVGPLLLARDGCSRTWLSGVNANKCARVKPSYTGQYCIDLFEIPQDHLEGLSVYNTLNTEPVSTLFPAGHGLPDTDYVLYIQSAYTTTCIQGGLNVIAYASYCQLDHRGRPVAGYVNVCPQMLADPYYDEQKVFWTVLHELFHALGFSSSLFEKFQFCSVRGSILLASTKVGVRNVTCRPYSRPVIKTVLSAKRLITPRVSAKASHHFECKLQSDTFGPILDTVNGTVQSHWDAAFMHGSIMMPTVTFPHLMSIDNITLSVFEDSGWYKVNYSYSDIFVWGKGMGCNFGLNPYCERSDNMFFCSKSDQGCHVLHMDKGICDTTPFLHNCRIYRPTSQDSCQAKVYNHTVDDSGEIYAANSRCFLSSLSKTWSYDTVYAASSSDYLSESTSDTLSPDPYDTAYTTLSTDYLSETTSDTSSPDPFETDLQGRCYEHGCDTDGNLLVRPAFSSDWIMCPYGETVSVPGYSGIIRCPMKGILCLTNNSLWSSLRVSTTPSVLTSTTNFSSSAVSRSLYLALAFVSLTSKLLKTDCEQFTNCTIDMLAATLHISSQQFHNIKLVYDDNTLYFTIATTSTGGFSAVYAAVTQLNTSVVKGNFVVVFRNISCAALSLRFRYSPFPFLQPATTPFDPPDSDPDDSDYVGKMVGTVIGSLAVVIVLLTIICFVRNRKRLHQCSCCGTENGRTCNSSETVLSNAHGRPTQNGRVDHCSILASEV